jgi:hypothetical protein
MSTFSKWLKLAILLLLLTITVSLFSCASPADSVLPTPSPTNPRLSDLVRAQITEEATVAPQPTSSPGGIPTLEATATPTVVEQTPTTISPTPSLTSQPVSSIKARILLRTAYLRQGPGTTYEIVGFLSRDDEVIVLARNRIGTWFNVLTSDGRRGWIGSSISEIMGEDVDINSIEVAATIPVQPTQTPSLTPSATATQAYVPPPVPSATPIPPVMPPPPPTSTPSPYPLPSPTVNPYP